METANHLIQNIAEKHLLKHPFYQKWNEGTLSKETLKTYAKQYYHHVATFPRYLSAAHSNCTDLKNRQTLLANLNDEETGSENHPSLWLQFVTALGETAEAAKNETLYPETQKLIEIFLGFARSSYEEGIGALLAYEHQVPEIAATKMAGLKKFYGVSDEKGLQFFKTHLDVDIVHTAELASLYNHLTPAQKEKADRAALLAADALWGFLDGIELRAAA